MSAIKCPLHLRLRAVPEQPGYPLLVALAEHSLSHGLQSRLGGVYRRVGAGDVFVIVVPFCTSPRPLQVAATLCPVGWCPAWRAS